MAIFHNRTADELERSAHSDAMTMAPGAVGTRVTADIVFWWPAVYAYVVACCVFYLYAFLPKRLRPDCLSPPSPVFLGVCPQLDELIVPTSP